VLTVLTAGPASVTTAAGAVGTTALLFAVASAGAFAERVAKEPSSSAKASTAWTRPSERAG
jgi:hypothetical protein